MKESTRLGHSRNSALLWRRVSFFCVAGFLFASLPHFWTARADNRPLADAIGAIEGDAISVQGPMSVEATNGQVKTILRSGSEIQVKSGQAHINLVEGGNITICGPAHFSVLKSGGALTIALDSGTIHAHIEGAPTLTIYTAQIQAHPIAIGNGAQDILVGLDANGGMCIRASKGAVRVEQQLTGQSLLIPQNGDVSLINGQLDSLRTSAGQCSCELQIATKAASFSTEISALASTEEIKKKAAEAKPSTPPAPAEKEEPIYQVFMPPLRYDASAKVQQDYDPNLIILVRRARVRPTLIFQGKVEGDPLVAQATPPAPPIPRKQDAVSQKPADDSAWTRVRTFIRRLWPSSS